MGTKVTIEDEVFEFPYREVELKPGDFPEASPTTFIPPQMYSDPRVFEAESRDVFPRVWQLVGDITDVTKTGDYLAEKLGDQPVVVLRDAEGAIRAFANVCRHRGAVLLEGKGNCGLNMSCPYHRWTYGLDGKLKSVPFLGEFEFDLDLEKLGLHELRVDVWERFAFIDLSGEAPPLASFLGFMPERLEHHRISDAKLKQVLDEEADGNWKIHVDNAFCDYHFQFVHRETFSHQAKKGLEEELEEFVGMSYVPWTGYDGEKEPFEGLTGRASHGSLSFSLFPNVFVGGFPNGESIVLSWSPLGADRTRVRVWSYSHVDEPDRFTDGGMLRKIMDEDYEISRRAHEGMKSPMYQRPGPRHFRELRIYGYQRALVALLKSGAERRENRAE